MNYLFKWPDRHLIILGTLTHQDVHIKECACLQKVQSCKLAKGKCILCWLILRWGSRWSTSQILRMMWSSLNGWSLSNLCSVCLLRWIIYLLILPFSVTVPLTYYLSQKLVASILIPMLFLSAGIWISNLLPNCGNCPRGDDDRGLHSDQRILCTSLSTSKPRQPRIGPVKETENKRSKEERKG